MNQRVTIYNRLRVTMLLTAVMLGAFTMVRAQYLVQGSAGSNGNDCFTLTPYNYYNTGAIWNQNSFSLNYNFDLSFQVFLGYFDGADGIAFVMKPSSAGIGGTGGGIGYAGLSPSIAVEYDTWQNDDPWYDHIAVHRNGDVNSTGTLTTPVVASATSYNIEDGQWHSTRITWNAITKTLEVYFDNILRLSCTNDLVANTFGGNPVVYWGFTGATGGARNLQQFCVTSLYFQPALTVGVSKTDETCLGANNGTATAVPTGGHEPATFLGWFNGTDLVTTENPATGLAPGTYTAMFTDAAGYPASNSVIIAPGNIVPSCSVTAVPSAGAYTGGPATTVYLGYGPQSVTLSGSADGGSSFSYSWSGLSTGMLSCTDCPDPLFTPTSEGSYHFSLLVTNEFGCSSSCEIVICVLDVRVPGSNGKKVYLCHVPEGNPNNPQTLSISVNAVKAHLTEHDDDHLGRCDQSCDNLAYKSGDVENGIEVTEVAEFGTTVYPNPFTDEVTISFESESEDFATVIIYDVTGKVVEKVEQLLPYVQYTFGSELKEGIYFGIVRQGERIQNIKIVKTR